jgi:hypothetical protein
VPGYLEREFLFTAEILGNRFIGSPPVDDMPAPIDFGPVLRNLTVRLVFAGGPRGCLHLGAAFFDRQIARRN